MAAASAPRRIAVVTGGSSGIGLETAALLGAVAASPRFHVIVVARRLDVGAAAVAELVARGCDAELAPVAVELTDDASIAALAEWLNCGPARTAGVHVLVNNAGLAYKGDAFGAEMAAHTLDVNLHGTLRVTAALLPLLRRAGACAAADDGPRVVVVASVAGRLGIVAPRIQARLQAPELALRDVDALAEEFLAAVRGADGGALGAGGWPRSMYGVSKLLLIAAANVLARDLAREGIAVASCCPGWCATAMSSFRGPRTPAQGAQTPAWLATRRGAPAQLAGGLYADHALVPW